MKECVTHHHACDCREAAHKAEIDALKAKLETLLEIADQHVAYTTPLSRNALCKAIDKIRSKP